MVCEENETDVTIGIPAVMLPQDAGESLQKDLKSNISGVHLILTNLVVSNSFVFYSPLYSILINFSANLLVFQYLCNFIPRFDQ